MAKFTIITNTIRRPLELVEKSIRISLSQVTNSGTPPEVVLVDQNHIPLSFSTDVQANLRFKHQHEVVPAVSMARNRAKYSSDCEWIIFCDDDGYLDQDYLSILEKLIHDYPQVEIFAGAIKRTDNHDYYSHRHAIGGDMKWFINTKLLMGSNFVIKKNIFESLGKFDEKFGAGAEYGSSEETDLAWNAFFKNHSMRYSPELVVFHVPPFSTDTANEISKAFRYGVGKGRLIKKWISLSRPSVAYELIEMLFLPLIKLTVFFFLFQLSSVKIQLSALMGRISGLIKK